MLAKPLLIPSGHFKAYLYDCDGTLSDTMDAHIEAWVAELGARGVTIPGSLIHELAGMPATLTVVEINRRYQVNLNPEEVAQAKENRFYDQFLDQIAPIKTVVAHLITSASEMKIAVVSGGRKRIVKETLKRIGVESYVQALVCAEDVKRGKPDPEPFLMAAQILGVAPHECLVFEDADLGIQSAENAGMKWVRVEAAPRNSTKKS